MQTAPWGDRYRSGFANIDETAHNERVGPHYLRRITAVGIYPLGRQPELYLYELSGNDSEWCLTCWDEAGYRGANDAEAGCHRVSRGGHYHNSARFARAAARTWGDPDPDDQYDPSRGFRLVIGPPFETTQGASQAFPVQISFPSCSGGSSVSCWCCRIATIARRSLRGHSTHSRQG